MSWHPCDYLPRVQRCFSRVQRTVARGALVLLFAAVSRAQPASTTTAPASGGAAAPRARNVLLIMADDLNCDLSVYDEPRVPTPHLARLAARGVRFQHAYCQFALCNPSRVSLLSGRRPRDTRVLDNQTPARAHLGEDFLFLPGYFRSRGYRAEKYGKIFHTGPQFDDARSWDIDVRDGRTAKNPPPQQIAQRTSWLDGAFTSFRLQGPEETCYDAALALQAVAALERLTTAGQPYFLAVGFRRPHSPYIAPQKYFQQFPAEHWLRDPEPPHVDLIPRWALTYQPTDRRPNPQEAAEIRAAYYASVAYLDAQVGRLLDAADRLGVWDSTAVLFVSDHGYHLGEHGGVWHKQTLFERGTRVPLLIAAPGAAQAATCQRLVELVDLYPTLCALCGLEAPPQLAGRDLSPLLAQPSADWPDVAHSIVIRRVDGRSEPLWGASVRTPRWRYTQWDEGRAGEELYDTTRDPHEYHNRADDPELGSVVAAHRQMLRER